MHADSNRLPEPSENPRVSVVIPVFNAKGHLGRAVSSALNQSMDSLEVIVVDDASTDGSIEELSVDDPRLIVISLEVNSGSPARPRNIALSQAKGEWVAFLDADDVWQSKKLEYQLALLHESGMSASSTNALKVSSGAEDEMFFNHCPNIIDLRMLLKRNLIITSSFIVNRELLAQCGSFSEQGTSIYEDYGMWLRIATRSEIAVDARPLLSYLDHVDGSFKSRYGAHFSNLKVTFRDFQVWSKEADRPVGLINSLQIVRSLTFAALARIRALIHF